MAALNSHEQFMLLFSEATRTSHDCSFEVGVAYGLQKPIRIPSLDGTLPPTFVQHIQAIDLPRIAKQKPWLEPADILLDEVIRLLASA